MNPFESNGTVGDTTLVCDGKEVTVKDPPTRWWLWGLLGLAAGAASLAVAQAYGVAPAMRKRNPTKGSAVAKHGGYVWATTYGVVTEESAAEGDYADQGWEHEFEDSAVYLSLADLLRDIPREDWLEWSSSRPEPHGWITSEAQQDMHDGSYTHKDLFIKHADGTPLTQSEVNYVDRAIFGARRGR